MKTRNNLYIVYDTKSEGLPVIIGTFYECVNYMGVKKSTFYARVNKHYTGKYKPRYEVCEYEEGEL